ncbi:MAG: hypothetical protein B5M53_07620 [Candidatus Cloacimonas sp. 4484_209]|nr:MAG: hypothetical protein B5M53_07620 [Candidatus Cloacimonas sp. 4484_209]
MKKLIFLLPAFFLSCVLQGDVSKPVNNYPIVVNIRVYGSDSLPFSGKYGNNYDTTQVNGIVPPGNENYVEYTCSIEDSTMLNIPAA